MTTPRELAIGTAHIAERIIVVRGHKVIVDADLAALYGTTTKRLNEQVRRNAERFPADFMFQLSNQELANLRSQSATSSWGGRRYAPNVFTEHGALMAASVLNTPRAVEVSLYVVRAFVQLREMLSANKELARQFAALEARIDKRLADQDQAIVDILKAIRSLMHPAEPARRPIGFVRPKEK